MEPFSEKEEVTTTSRLAGILSGNPPRLNLVDYAAGRNGVKRHMTQQIPVLDADLFAKLQAEVEIGDQIRATTVYEYTESGSKAYLTGFQKINETVANGTKNGKRGFSSLPAAANEPRRQHKQKIQHSK